MGKLKADRQSNSRPSGKVNSTVAHRADRKPNHKATHQITNKTSHTAEQSVASGKITKSLAKKDARKRTKLTKWVSRISQQEHKLLEEKMQSEAKRNPLSHLDGLAARLMETVDSSAPSAAKPAAPVRVSSTRGRKHTLAKEAEQFRMVLNNSRFRTKPLAVIGQHLESCVQAERDRLRAKP